MTVYGITKLQGENNIINLCKKYYILRTSWLFGDGKNFIRTIIRLSKENSEINVVNDQFGNPTYTVDLAHIINQLIMKEIPFGIYNATNLGRANWLLNFFKYFKMYLLASSIVCIPFNSKSLGRRF